MGARMGVPCCLEKDKLYEYIDCDAWVIGEVPSAVDRVVEQLTRLMERRGTRIHPIWVELIRCPECCIVIDIAVFHVRAFT